MTLADSDMTNTSIRPPQQRRKSLRDLMKPFHSQKDSPYVAKDDGSTRTVSTHSSSTTACSSFHSRMGCGGDDDSSTLTAPSSSLLDGNQKSSRVVHFGPAKVVATIPCISDISSEERWNTWWCPQEYQAMRLAAKYSTKQIRKCDPACASAVEQAFSAAVEAAPHFNEFSEPEVSQASLLDPWCNSKMPTRGLEKYVSTQHKTERFNSVAESRKLVAQSTQSAEDVALTYRNFTRYARVFALFMGHADHTAAQKAYESDAEGRRRRFLQRSFSTASTDDDNRSMTSADSQESNISAPASPPARRRSLLGGRRLSMNGGGGLTASLSVAAAAVLPDQSVSPSISGNSSPDAAKNPVRKTALERSFSRRGSLLRAVSQRGEFQRSASRRALMNRQESMKLRGVGAQPQPEETGPKRSVSRRRSLTRAISMRVSRGASPRRDVFGNKNSTASSEEG